MVKKTIAKPRGYWQIKENVLDEALKYTTRKDFRKSAAYNSALENGWHEEACAHMQFQGNKMKRLIYKATFPDNAIYIGLTYNLERRENDHLTRRGTIRKYIEQTNTQPIFERLTPELLDSNVAAELEVKLIEEYKSKGFKVLNVSKGGTLGTSEKIYTKEMVSEEASKYKSKKDFKNAAWQMYQAAWKNKWISDVCKHMEPIILPKNYWTLDKIQIEALKFNTRVEFFSKSPKAYKAAINNNCLDDVCKHMTSLRLPNKHWNYETVSKEAKKYNTRKQFQLNNGAAYRVARLNGFLDDICLHMDKLVESKGYWTIEKLKEESIKYKTRMQFKKGNSKAYSAAVRSGKLNEICYHMPSREKGYKKK